MTEPQDEPKGRGPNSRAAATAASPASAMDLLARNVKEIDDLEKASRRAGGWAEHFGDRMADFAGTMRFVVLHVVFFAAWIALNLGIIVGVAPFDPFPFTFLTFCVSLEAILLTAIVLISQKRLGRLADERAHIDLQINLLAEQESTETLRLLRALCAHHRVAIDGGETQGAALAADTKPSAIAEAVRRRIEARTGRDR